MTFLIIVNALMSMGAYFLGVYMGRPEKRTKPFISKPPKMFDEKTYFVSPMSVDEAFESAKNIDDFINKTK